ncbi:hypothetical protein EDB89DRAFT_1547999 [Lactarius sanguifluus]|nr:hypothetical protein EDB89DRAFT_1547999 [Lactarius sanguifluus]
MSGFGGCLYLDSSRCLTGFALLVTTFLSCQHFLAVNDISSSQGSPIVSILVLISPSMYPSWSRSIKMLMQPTRYLVWPHDPEVEEICLNLKRKEELEVASVLIRFRTLTGINVIFHFGTAFFTNAGIYNPFLSPLPLSVSA